MSENNWIDIEDVQPDKGMRCEYIGELWRYGSKRNVELKGYPYAGKNEITNQFECEYESDEDYFVITHWKPIGNYNPAFVDIIRELKECRRLFADYSVYEECSGNQKQIDEAKEKYLQSEKVFLELLKKHLLLQRG